MKVKLLIIFTCLISINIFAQELFYSNILHGGVTGAGFDFGSGSGTISKVVDIPSGSTIEKAYLITLQFAPNLPNDTLILNGISYPFNHFLIASSQFSSGKIFNCSQNKSTINVLDITDNIDPNTVIYTLDSPIQDLSCGGNGYMPFYLYIVYANNSLPKTACNLFLNPKDVVPNQICNLYLGMPMNNNNPIGLGMCGEWFCDTIIDGSYVKVNNYNIGLIGGQESGYPCGGVHSDFAYYNNQLFGLGNDTENDLMAGTDALADIKNYVNNFDDSVIITFNYQTPSNTAGLNTNMVMLLMLNYTTPCDTFPVAVSPDTTICQGEQVQLYATGGQSYEWTALGAEQDTSSTNTVPGLSCSTCLNPVFTGDSSMTYTVRIWNNNNCSVVRPVHINVSHPQKISCYTGETKCGASTGYIKAISLPENLDKWYVVTPSGDTLDEPAGTTFSGLGAGDYSVYSIDTLGCKSKDTLVTITSYNNTVADFTVSPSTGAAPLEVQFDNNSENATDFEWLLDGISTGPTPIHAFDTSGVYKIGLVAWELDKSCADTVWKTVYVYDSLVARVPNVFTPNRDGINDYFNVTVNLPVETHLVILNRWGNAVFQWRGELKKGQNDLWDGRAKNGELVSDGVYFYRLEFTGLEGLEKEQKLSGFVQVFGEN